MRRSFPVTLRTKLPPGDSRRVLTITLVIDQNPAPMAAKFELGPDANVTEISTRVRVNNYTDVHAVAELSDGKLYMTKTYVKASGGCSAPAAKNADEAKSRLGQMRYRQFAQARRRSRQRHPRGPDHDRPSQQFRPADGPGHPALHPGLLRQPSCGCGRTTAWCWRWKAASRSRKIPISASPMFPNGAKHFRAEAKDTEGHVFQNEWKVDDSGIVKRRDIAWIVHDSTSPSRSIALPLRPARAADR